MHGNDPPSNRQSKTSPTLRLGGRVVSLLELIKEFGVIAELVDSSGNVITRFNGPVTISLAVNPGKDHLSGTLTVKAVKGVATFAPLVLHRIGNGYKLKVSAAGAVSALTEPFRVVGFFTPPP